MVRPLGLYVHIPFCERKCLYCDFLSFTAGNDLKKLYVDLLVDELKQWDNFLSTSDFNISTVFFGGGTPTCLSADELVRVGNAIHEMKVFRGDNIKDGSCKGEIEYTVEMNPATVLKSHIKAFNDMGVNRISLGLQSARNEELKILGRIHKWEDFLNCYSSLRESGFDNLNVDLMSSIPGQTLDSYKDTLEKVVSLEPEHISAYSLIIENGTPFEEMQQSGEILLPDEDEDRKMYALTKKLLKDYGLRRYEISNYSIHGKECRHNLVYWSGGSYLGVGLGASSYIDNKRWRNPDNMKEYRRTVLDRAIVENTMGSAVSLSEREQMEEYMFLGLRKTSGISINGFFKEFGVKLKHIYGDVVGRLLENNLLAQSGDYLYLTERGIDVSNMVLAEFLL